MRNFVRLKSSRIGEFTLSFTYIGKSRPCANFNVENMCFIAIRENKILAKISKFTVLKLSRKSDALLQNVQELIQQPSANIALRMLVIALCIGYILQL